MSDATIRRSDGFLRVFLVRHGQTLWNAEGRMQGSSDVPLSPLGHLQADAVAARLSSETLAAVYSSDLSRAAQTAQRIADRHGLNVVQTDLLRETCLGDWEGLTDEQIIAAGAREALANYRRDPVSFRPPGSEPVDKVGARIYQAMAAVSADHPGQAVAIVGHGGSLRALFCQALGAPLRCMFGIRMDNASLSLIEHGPTRSFVHFINDTGHLIDTGNGQAGGSPRSK